VWINCGRDNVERAETIAAGIEFGYDARMISVSLQGMRRERGEVWVRDSGG
jgi:hypothetical protein